MDWILQGKIPVSSNGMKIQIQILRGLDFLDFPNPPIQSFQALLFKNASSNSTHPACGSRVPIAARCAADAVITPQTEAKGPRGIDVEPPEFLQERGESLLKTSFFFNEHVS